MTPPKPKTKPKTCMLPSLVHENFICGSPLPCPYHDVIVPKPSKKYWGNP